MNEDAVRVSRIEFGAAMPSLLLLEAVRLAFSIQCLVPVSLSFVLFLAAGSWLGKPTRDNAGLEGLVPSVVPAPFLWMHADAHTIAVRGFSAGITPFVRLPLFMLLSGLTGVAVSRGAGLRICADRRSGAVRSIRHAVRSIRSIIVSSLLAGLLCGMALGVFWLLLKFTVLVSGSSETHTLSLVPACLGALFLIAVAGVCSAGWLLSLSAMGVDSCDGPEALSRGISYILSRFRRSLCYAVIICLITWFLSYACSYLLFQAGTLSFQSLDSSTDEIVLNNQGFIQFRWFVVESWKLSVFFSAVTVSYILLRQEEDGVDLREFSG